jgi:DNA primase
MSVKLRYSDFVDRIDIDALEEAIGFEPIESDGVEDRGYCPDYWGLHSNGDTTGKFSINREKKVYNCWVCDGGSLLSLAMEANDVGATDATEWLYQFVNGEPTEEEFQDDIARLLSDPADQVEIMPYFNARVLDKWMDNEWSPKARRWLNQRGIDLELAGEYRVGFNPEALRHAPQNKNEDNYVGPAIILPLFWRKRLVGWQHRWLEADDKRPKWVPKYSNTPDFPKRKVLFNYDSCARRMSMPVVVESVPTVLMLESLGVPAVATYGAQVSEEQLKLLRTFQQGIRIAPDHDEAGIKGRNQITRALENYIPILHVPFVGKEGGDLQDLWPREDLIFDHLERAYEPLNNTLLKMADR